VSATEILAVGAHPDDIELSCGGLLLQMAERGYRFSMIDLTAGELGSRGTREQRAKEAKAAAEFMGASARECLGLPDTKLAATDGAVRLMVECLRKYRPKLVVSMSPDDAHPDHAAAARIVDRAAFFAGLKNFEADGAPHRVRQVIRYSRQPEFRPSFVVDISDSVETKLAAVRCYESQFTRIQEGHRTPISAPDFEEDLRAFWRFHGMSIGAIYAEPYQMDGPPGVPDPVAALCEQRRDF